MPKQWKETDLAKPPLDGSNRCESLWLFDGERVFRGSYVDYGDDEPVELDAYFDDQGNGVEATHFLLTDPGEAGTPAPPV